MKKPLYIDQNFETTINDLKTLEDFDEARTHLCGAIAALAERSAEDPTNHKVKSALRYRRLALQQIQERRAFMRRQIEDESLIGIISDLDPDIVLEARRIHHRVMP